MGVSLRAIRPKRLKVLNPTVTSQQARDGIRQYLEEVKKILVENYASAQPSPRYMRRGMKGGVMSGWKVYVRSNNFGELINNIRGVEFVQGRYRTRRHSRAGWKTINQVARQTRPRFAEIMNRKLTPRRAPAQE